MSLKDKVVSESLKLASHPAVAQLVRDERFMKLLMAALSVPGKLEQITEAQRERFIDAMGLASRQEVDDLKRSVRSLETELGRLRRERSD